MSVSAAPQPRAWAPTYGDDAFTKICEGSAVLAPLNTLRFTVVTVRMVNSSGAVSPAARATASRAPLTIPPMRCRQHHRHRHPGLGGTEGVAPFAQ